MTVARTSVNHELQPASGAEAERFYLEVDRTEKDYAKRLGARWDRERLAWFVPAGVDPGRFRQWWPKAADAAPPVPGVAERAAAEQASADGREYLAVPYRERVAARSAGARWDNAARAWYAGPDADHAALARWRPAATVSTHTEPEDPRVEFGLALQAAGFLLAEGHPIMDGHGHRSAVLGDDPGEAAGFYVGYLDGHPAGYLKNHRTGHEERWRATGYRLTDEQRALIAADGTARQAARLAEESARHEQTAERLARQLERYRPVREPTPYLQRKGLGVADGIFTDERGSLTIVPAFDIEGRHWSTLYIREDGRKRMARGGRKEGLFHVVGGFDSLASVPVLVLAEGYATAARAREALGGAPVVAGFDSGNLVPVAKALRERFPEKPLLVLGDDDMDLQRRQGVNPGRSKALEAARVAGGKAIFPTFLPADIKESPTSWSDFDDLARSALGSEGVGRQIGPTYDQLAKKYSHRRITEQRTPSVRTDTIDSP